MATEIGHPLPSRVLRTAHGRATRSREVDATRRLVYLTDEQIAVLKAALGHWERAIADTSYDPQVEEWAPTHTTETGKRAAAIAQALAAARPESDW